ncbi:7TM domain-containing protein, partial [Pseudomonas sp. UBA800]|uniref:7TM domain-containing protein n=1 Tax=Pseudomonas sp. UBA800 TaxID=1947344 RepID=UPI00257FB3F4
AADRHRFIVVYPLGIKHDWNVGFDMPYLGGSDDVGFTEALLEKLKKDYRVDTSRVYAAGLSRGGFFALRLAAELPHVFAAVASVGGPMPEPVVQHHTRTGKLGVMLIHGTADGVVAYDGKASGYLSAMDSHRYWIRRNGLEGAAEQLRSFNGDKWLYFNPETGEQGLPKDRLVWWTGDEPLLNLEGGRNAQVTFTLNSSEMNAIRLAKLTDENTDADFLEYSLYGLPLQTQQTFMIMVMIPIGVLVILVLRNLIGIQTLGTFTPVLIALAFRETQLGFGIVLFTVITALGLSLRSYLEHLKLQMLPRLSVVLTFVVVLIAAISLFSHKLGLERGLSVALFPMVILTMTIERLSITWEERGGGHAMKVAIGTLFAASLAHLLMMVPELVYFVFTFPAVLLILVGFMLAMGRYRGYRLTELVRFKAFLKKADA